MPEPSVFAERQCTIEENNIVSQLFPKSWNIIPESKVKPK